MVPYMNVLLEVCMCVHVHYQKLSDLLLAFQLGFELQWPLATLLQFYCNSTYFYNMSYNECNSPYVEPYMYEIHATQLQLCKNNYCATLMQLVCNYCCNVMLMLIFIHPSIMNFIDFYCNLFAAYKCSGNLLMVTTNWQLCDNSHQHKVVPMNLT